VVDVEVEVALAEAVRDWTRECCPGEPSVSERAVAVALDSFVGGASVAEACEQARSYVRAWVYHPAHSGYLLNSRLPLAS
jgi:hypothetical protein